VQKSEFRERMKVYFEEKTFILEFDVIDSEEEED
jgi:hypothetical protein